jgi:hypothetical protein
MYRDGVPITRSILSLTIIQIDGLEPTLVILGSRGRSALKG